MAACSTGISTATKTVNYEVATFDVDVSSNGSQCPWSASSEVDWMQVANATRVARAVNGSGPGTVTVSVNDNPAGADRTGMVQIAGSVFTVTQGG